MKSTALPGGLLLFQYLWVRYKAMPCSGRCFGKPADKKRKLYNGMIKCDVFMYGNV